jgi:hypothetical protein
MLSLSNSDGGVYELIRWIMKVAITAEFDGLRVFGYQRCKGVLAKAFGLIAQVWMPRPADFAMPKPDTNMAEA